MSGSRVVRAARAAALLAAGAFVAQAGPEVRPVPSAAERFVRTGTAPGVAALLREVLERNPRLAAARARARAAAQKAPQAGTLPDPRFGVGLFLLPPETRTGPQRASASLSQHFPWFGKLTLRERAALEGASAVAQRAEAVALDVVSEARRLAIRLAFLVEEQRIVEEDLATLSEFERLARAHYETGAGLAQAVVKLQAEITRDRTRLLDIDAARVRVAAALNELRDRPAGAALPKVSLPELPELPPDLAELRRWAEHRRPEVLAALAEIERSRTMVELAHKDYRPDFTVGLTYTAVGGRSDPAGKLSPPPDNGEDIVGLAASINLPIRKRRLTAQVREAIESRGAAEAIHRTALSEISGALEDLGARIPILRDQYDLFHAVLGPQAEESLNSARYAYETGRADVLDLLDAERVLLEVRLGELRARTELHLAYIDLERAIGSPLADVSAARRKEAAR